ncbi:MAG: ribonuclease H family protein [Planctomycetota bacterium]
MAAKKPKFYVVWEGRTPGVYQTWAACQAEISGFSGAKYKSFGSLKEAEAAFGQAADLHWGKPSPGGSRKSKSTPQVDREQLAGLGVDMNAWCVDAACKGNPGPLEYQGVELESGINLFHRGPYTDGTVNVGEFLAIVHALALLDHASDQETPIYSDSRIGISWVKQGVCKTKLTQTRDNQKLFNLVRRAEKWLAEHRFDNPILKWETKTWGEIPADFGRK